ncbi:hypothetical protein WAI453_012932 [Rhynchosporium graminicola]
MRIILYVLHICVHPYESYPHTYTNESKSRQSSASSYECSLSCMSERENTKMEIPMDTYSHPPQPAIQSSPVSLYEDMGR